MLLLFFLWFSWVDIRCDSTWYLLHFFSLGAAANLWLFDFHLMGTFLNLAKLLEMSFILSRQGLSSFNEFENFRNSLNSFFFLLLFFLTLLNPLAKIFHFLLRYLYWLHCSSFLNDFLRLNFYFFPYFFSWRTWWVYFLRHLLEFYFFYYLLFSFRHFLLINLNFLIHKALFVFKLLRGAGTLQLLILFNKSLALLLHLLFDFLLVKWFNNFLLPFCSLAIFFFFYLYSLLSLLLFMVLLFSICL